ncbi:MAG: M1 family metallopeptidase [Flavobacteriales bacterium]
MSRYSSIFFAAVLLAAGSAAGQTTPDRIKQYIHIAIDPGGGGISVSDTLLLPRSLQEGERSFLLNAKLEISSTGKGTKIARAGEEGGRVKYRIEGTDEIKGLPALVLSYAGNINEGFEQGSAEYARGFKLTNGIVSDTGVYLAGSTCWLPALDFGPLSTFKLWAELPAGWSAVSEGKRHTDRLEGDKRHITYICAHPIDEVYLVANRWTEYNDTLGDVRLQAFLRTPDRELAVKYLRATKGYMELYNKLLGPYPFSKFALVENFWETGYGMPSFTLLGPQVIRFPWIIYSSYPHELLHNYWGNGVFVDPALGNWCEGITAYMADHLFKEQGGQGDAYRQATLEKFTNYVNDGNDFPIKEFVNRNNPAQEAVGYGKVLMVNNMLRCMLGDEQFLQAYRVFYRKYRFRRAGFDEIRACFEKVSGQELKWFFDQWILRKGAPQLALSDVSVSDAVDVQTKRTAYTLSFKLYQVQPEDIFTIEVPVEVYTDKGPEVLVNSLEMNQREQTFTLTFDQRPLRLAIDPHFDVMRKLDKAEISPTLSQLFGQQEAVLVLPAKSPHAEAYEKLAELWKKNQEGQGYKLEVIKDDEITQLPPDKGVWIMGYENKFSNLNSFQSLYADAISEKDGEAVTSLKKEGALVYVIPNGQLTGLPIGFLAAHDSKVIEGLSHRLLHYGKYSLLGFEGAEGKNALKSVLPVLHSPLLRDIHYKDYSGKIISHSPVRKALSSLIEE